MTLFKLYCTQFGLSMHHHPHNIGHNVSRFPSQLRIRLHCIALTKHDVGWPNEVVIYLHVITPIQPQLTKGSRREILQTISRSSCNYKVVSFRLLHDTPHCLDIFRRPTPIPLDREIAELKRALTARSNAAGRTDNLFGYKAFGPEWRFMVEQDSIGSKQAVGIAIVNRRPMCSCFGNGIGAARPK